MIAAGVMLALAAIPGLPKFSFLLLAAVMALLGLADAGRKAAQKTATPAERRRQTKPEGRTRPGRQESAGGLVKLDELSLEVGYGLVPLVDASKAASFWPACKALRNNLAQQLGFIVPPVHITDNARSKPANT